MSQAIRLFNSNKEPVYPCPYFPVGYIYLSTTNISPATYFGGVWEQIKDRFLLTAGSTYKAGATGGSATVSLATKHLPSHNHSFSTGNSGEHTHYVMTFPYSGSSQQYYCIAPSPGGNVNEGTQWRGGYASSAGSHAHSGTTNSTGSGTAHDNMPPYLVVYAWKRVS